MSAKASVKTSASLAYRIKKHKLHLMMILPVMVWYIIFKYLPIYGVTLAWKEFYILKGINGSPWVGWVNFERLLTSYDFKNVFTNTLILGFWNFVIGFPMPIILALALNELRGNTFKRVTQTISYLPHFVSWVILTGIFMEVHPDPDKAPCDGPNMLSLKELPAFLKLIKRFDAIAKNGGEA